MSVTTFNSKRQAVITDWQNFPSVAAGTLITAVTTNPTYGAVVQNKAIWRRVGDSMEIMWNYHHTTAGSNGSGIYLFNLPAGYIIDVSKTGTANTLSASNRTPIVGTFLGNYTSDTGLYLGEVIVYSSNQLAISIEYFPGGTTPSVGLWNTATGLGTFNVANLTLSLRATLPIVGWNVGSVFSNSRVEYAFNSDTTNADDSTSFGYGANGNLVPVVASSTKKKRIRFTTTVQATDQIFLQIQPNGVGPWVNCGDSVYQPDVVNTYGFILYRVAGSSTDIDVTFFSTRADGWNNTSWTTENSNGTRWRVVKCANPLTVQAIDNSTIGSSYARLDTIGTTTAGWGSTNNQVARFINVSVHGSDLTVSQSATLADSITVNTTGLYLVEGLISYSSNYQANVITKNSTQLTTDPYQTTINGSIARSDTYAGPNGSPISKTVTLTAGDVIRFHGRGAVGSYNQTLNSDAYFQVTRLA